MAMTTERATLQEGQWFMYPIDTGMPETLTIYKGEVTKRKVVRKITRQQARALSRWYGDTGLWHQYRDGNNRWQSVYVVGDIDAWEGEEEDSADPGEPCPKCGAPTWGGWCDDCFAADQQEIK